MLLSHPKCAINLFVNEETKFYKGDNTFIKHGNSYVEGGAILKGRYANTETSVL